MRKVLVATRWSVRSLFGAFVTWACLMSSSLASAQTTNPNVIEFLPSPEHALILTSGAPAVSRYDLVFYQQGATDGFMVTNLGKPAPQADGLIRVDMSLLLASWPLPNTACEARIAAIGPNGTAVSDLSAPFVYACSYALSSSGSAMAAAGGTGSVGVTAGAKCGWTATSSASWVTITSGAAGLGTATVGFTVAPNGGAARTATLLVAGQVYTVSQAASPGSATPPTVQFTQPASGAIVVAGSAVQVSASATVTGSSIVKVDVLANGSLLRSLTSAPYTFAWTPTVAGSYSLQAVAYAANGLNASSATVSVSVSAAAPAPASPRQLSDQPWVSMTNGSGPVEKDRSNGSASAGDGRALTLNGKAYTKGLGAAAPSEIRYALNAACSVFEAQVGVDDEVGRKGSVVFQVWADNVKLFDSGRMTGASATRPVLVDVTNRQQLSLVITNAGDGSANDHGDWSDARVTCAQTVVPQTTTYLSDVTAVSSVNGWGPVEKDRSNGDLAPGDGNVLTLAGKAYAKGLGAHGNSDIRFALHAACSTFQAAVGVDDEVGPNGSIVFQVWSDGVKLFDSGTMTGSSATQNVAVSLAGRTELALVIVDGADGNASDHGDWADAKVACTPTVTTRYASDTSWLSATNGWGPVERDRSNGDLAANDGNALTLNGQTYAKGLGAHGASDIRFALNGQCSTFQARVGVDAEAGVNGSIVFQVWTDGVQIFDSGLLTGSGASQAVNVNVAGRTALALIITDASDGNAFDHGDWADARLTCTSSIGTP